MKEITSHAALVNAAARVRHAFRTLTGDRKEIDAAFLKLRARLDRVASAAWGFVPDADEVIDALLRDLIAARDAAYKVREAELVAAITAARQAEREEKARRPF